MDIVVGMCRFSFLGRSDWAAYRQRGELTPAQVDAIAADLYAEPRMQARFRSFETLCLPSILAQKDPRFLFLVISSPRMPAQWRARLQALCDPHDNIRLLWSDSPTLGEALAEPLSELHDLSDGSLWQFRLDDDDAVDVHFMTRLRRNIARMKGLRDCAISTARGVSVALYDDQPKTYLEYNIAFHSAGLTTRLSQPGRSIFGFGHFGMRNRMSHFVDHDDVGALMLKWPSDSRALDLDNLTPDYQRLTARRFGEHVRHSFPFLRGYDFDDLRANKEKQQVVSG